MHQELKMIYLKDNTTILISSGDIFEGLESINWRNEIVI